MRAIGNVLWFLLGGVWMGLGWYLAGVLMALSIVGLPWARSCFVIGTFSFFPFGKDPISRKELTGKDDLGTSGFGKVFNIIWLIFAGIWLAIGHALSAIACFISIIGIPFGFQHFKLAELALMPVGMTVVDTDVAEAARNRLARARLLRG